MTTKKITKRISVYSPKGGVGKTCLVTHVADCFAKNYNLSVLVRDNDPQLSLYDSVVRKKTSYCFDVTDREPTASELEKYDILIMDFRPAAATGKKGLLGDELKLITTSDLIVVPTRISRMDIRSVKAVAKIAAKVPIINVLGAVDLDNPNHAAFVIEYKDDYLALSYRDVYSITLDEFSTIYTNESTSLKGQQAAKSEVAAICDHILKKLKPSYVIPKKSLDVMPKLVIRAMAAVKKHERNKQIRLDKDAAKLIKN